MCLLKKFMMNFYGVFILTASREPRDRRTHPSRRCAVDYLLIACKEETEIQMSKCVIAIIKAYLL